MVVLPAPAVAQIVFSDTPAAAAQPQPKPDTNKSDVNKLICRSQDTLGSRLDRHQVCLTQQQWTANEQEAKSKVQQMQVQGLISH